MVVEIEGGAAAGRLPEAAGWLLRLLAVWQDQRADALVPDADELFLADLADMIPHLLLALRDEDTGGFRIEFAGAAAKAVLGPEPVGETPEHGPLEHPLAWLGTGFVRARRPAVPGPRWLRAEDRLGLFLPYGAFDGRVTLVLAGIARSPIAARGGRVVPLRPVRRAG